MGYPTAKLRALDNRVHDGVTALIERAKATGTLCPDFTPEDVILCSRPSPASPPAQVTPRQRPSCSSRWPSTASAPNWRGPHPSNLTPTNPRGAAQQPPHAIR